MNYCTVSDYEQQKIAFYKKHGQYKEQCSLSGDTQRKTVFFEDGATWYEVSNKQTRNCDVHITMPNNQIHSDSTELDFFMTEFWSSDNATSQIACDLYYPARKSYER